MPVDIAEVQLDFTGEYYAEVTEKTKSFVTELLFSLKKKWSAQTRDRVTEDEAENSMMIAIEISVQDTEKGTNVLVKHDAEPLK